MSAEQLVTRFRQFLLWLTVLVCVGVCAELILISHDKESLQFVPYILCGLAVMAALWVLARPSRNSIWALRTLMVLMALGGLLGSYEHISGNLSLADFGGYFFGFVEDRIIHFQGQIFHFLVLVKGIA